MYFSIRMLVYFCTLQEAIHVQDYHYSGSDLQCQDEERQPMFGYNVNCVDADEERVDAADENNIDNGDKPIFEGSDITVGQVVTMIYSYALRHSITKLALQDLLKLINTIVGPNNIPSSIYMINKYVQSSEEKTKLHFYCPNCLQYIGYFTEASGHITCNNCEREYERPNLVKKGTFFIVNSLKCQLKEMFQESGTCISEKLNYRFTRQKLHPNNFEDIYDGELYKAIEGLNDANNISLSWNTDGVPVFNSSNVSMWPIQCTINELPPKLRRDNILLTGLWFGNGKPDPSVFLQPFVEELNDLAENGFTWVKPNSGNLVVSKVFTLTCPCDSVARCMLQNLKQFNGRYGCAWCLHEGERVDKGRGSVQVYPYLEEPPAERTHMQTVENAEEAHRQGEAVYGVKGPSILMLLTTFNIVQGFTVDYLHNSLLGVARYFGRLWFDSSNHGKEYYIGTQTDKIDDRLTSIQPPNNLTRAPRSLSHRRFWKGSEWRSWLLFYSLPCLVGVLKDVYLRHWLLLVHGLSLLLSESISEIDIVNANIMLAKFVLLVDRYYGRTHLTYNVHQLLHAAGTVRNWGPLWANSTFMYESFNGMLLKMFHGTQGVPLQVINNFIVWRHLPKLVSRYVEHKNPHHVQAYCKNMLDGLLSTSHAFYLGDEVTLLGCPQIRIATVQERLVLETVLNDPVPDNVSFFYRVIFRKKLIHTNSYERATRRNSSCVVLHDGAFGIVTNICAAENTCFILYKSVVVNSHSSIVTDRQTGANAPHIKIVTSVSDDLSVCQPQDISNKCIFIDKNNLFPHSFVCTFPNTIESD